MYTCTDGRYCARIHVHLHVHVHEHCIHEYVLYQAKPCNVAYVEQKQLEQVIHVYKIHSPVRTIASKKYLNLI